MTIARFFDEFIVIERMRTLTGRQRGFQSTATSEGHIQELDDRARQALGILERRAWHAWFPVDLNVQEGDRLTDENGKKYLVQEVTVKDYHFGINQHTEVLLLEENN